MSLSIQLVNPPTIPPFLRLSDDPAEFRRAVRLALSGGEVLNLCYDRVLNPKAWKSTGKNGESMAGGMAGGCGRYEMWGWKGSNVSNLCKVNGWWISWHILAPFTRIINAQKYMHLAAVGYDFILASDKLAAWNYWNCWAECSFLQSSLSTGI